MRPVALVLTYAALIAWTVVCLFPLYWVAVTSLKGEAELVHGPLYLPFVDFTPTLESWRFILLDAAENLRLQFFNSAFVGVCSTALTILVGAMFVYGLSRIPFAITAAGLVAALLSAAAVGSGLLGSPWLAVLLAVAMAVLLIAARRLHRRGPAVSKQALIFVLLATRILPPVIVVLPIYFMALQTHTLDTRFALIVTYTATNLPIAVWLLMPVVGYRATEQEEAAQLDGASHLGIFFRILLPMVAAGVGATAILIFFLAWNEYLFAAYLTGSNAMTLPPWVVGQLSMREAQVGGDLVEWSRLSAAIVLTVAPMLLLLAFVQRALGSIGAWRRA
jgi:multiple sugar transport system permease protein